MAKKMKRHNPLNAFYTKLNCDMLNNFLHSLIKSLWHSVDSLRYLACVPVCMLNSKKKCPYTDNERRGVNETDMHMHTGFVKFIAVELAKKHF